MRVGWEWNPSGIPRALGAVPESYLTVLARDGVAADADVDRPVVERLGER